MPNTRLKRLLDKKKTALAMPKHRLADFEEEYAELLDRINAERERLGIDSERINKTIESFHLKNELVVSFLEKHPEHKKRIRSLENQVRKAAAGGDLENMEYCKNRLSEAWRYIENKSKENQQTSIFYG